MLIDTGVVIVHHKNFPAVLDTISDFLTAGVPEHRVIVVDNSESETLRASLESALPTSVERINCRNAGYGAAANVGIQQHLEKADPPDYIIVSSHETRFSPQILERLRQTLREDSGAGAVGPVLTLEGPGNQIWSTGGVYSRFARRPTHRLNMPVGLADCEWLDGAFVMYRAEALRNHRFDPAFFMYYEETDLHARMRSSEWRILVDPGSSVTQSTKGAPPYFVGRSGGLFAIRHTAPPRAILAIIREGLRFAIKAHGDRSRVRNLASYLKGVRHAIRYR
ncbi:glycosyltransferase [Microbacterium oleivorans]|uniref:Glycosyltransferase 2-like domain-containing protein n=1 Tax=Microbacterium oleivorans TaxID=273677 RepID=A0A177K7F3_9MICO|nr:glycosyltransferase family 2 protein [Microbacterium oleivorans]OAH49329.1 hypothetical protein AYL44_10690 [Microbacterium oleivorans]